MKRLIPLVILFMVSVIEPFFLGCNSSPHPSAEGQAPRSPTPSPIEAPLKVETLASGLERPWGMAFLPDGRILVTERPGRLRLVSKDGSTMLTINGKLSPPLEGLPEVYASGQGGLLDVALDPNFAKNQMVYLSYAEPGEKGTAGTAVAKGRLVGNRLDSVRVIYRQTPKSSGSSNHFGSRLVFRGDGTLFITQGDRYNQRNKVQDLSNHFGKIVRINPDGTIPKDNPFYGEQGRTIVGRFMVSEVEPSGARPEIWSYGHRNVQCAALHPMTGELWTVEHGARGGDELNHPEPGKNYGWPVITYGVDYSGASIGEGTAKPGMEQPVYYWDPVIAPSGMCFYTGEAFPQWKGSIFIGSLTPGLLVRLTLKDNKVTGEERYLYDLHERIRDVRQGPDGLLYLLTDNPEGRILRLSPDKVR